MTTAEFSNEFDTLVASYRRFKNFDDKENLDSIEFDEYEKSVFLTQAQEDLVKSYYSGKNPFRESFEANESLRRDLEKLVKTQKITDKITTNAPQGISDNSVFFKLPDDVWFITYESVHLKDEILECADDTEVIVVPTTQDDYYRISQNPFRQPSKRRALRLDVADGIVEIISKYNVSSYLVRYLQRPTPIVLIDLPNGLTINNVNKSTECILNSAIHREILLRAVQIALSSKFTGVKTEENGK